MIKFGTVSQIDPVKGLARVDFDADGIVSDWLPCLMRKTLDEKESFPFDDKEHVACLMDEHCENGVILGCIYSEASAPALTTKDLFGIVFSNGDFFKYDRAAKKLFINVGTEIVFNGGSNDGLVLINSLVSRLNNIENAYNDLVVKFNTHIHSGGTISGSTGVPTVTDTDLITATVKADIENIAIKQ